MIKHILAEEDLTFRNKFVQDFKHILMAIPDFMGGIASLDHQPLLLAGLNEEFGVTSEEIFNFFRNQVASNLFNDLIQSKKPKKLLVVRSFINYLPKIFTASWLPIINPATQQVVAIMINVNRLEVCNMSSIFAQFYKYGKTNVQSLDSVNLNLTNREKQVIFFFMLNFSSQDIADLIAKIENKTLSKNSIDQMFTQQLCPKFGVYNRKALYTKLQDLGYDRLIPHNVLQDGFILDISDYLVFG